MCPGRERKTQGGGPRSSAYDAQQAGARRSGSPEPWVCSGVSAVRLITAAIISLLVKLILIKGRNLDKVSRIRIFAVMHKSNDGSWYRKQSVAQAVRASGTERKAQGGRPHSSANKIAQRSQECAGRAAWNPVPGAG